MASAPCGLTVMEQSGQALPPALRWAQVCLHDTWGPASERSRICQSLPFPEPFRKDEGSNLKRHLAGVLERSSSERQL